MSDALRPGEDVLRAWDLANACIEPIAGGHINASFRVETPAHGAGRRLFLQRLNPIFDPAVHEDIEAVTAHLEARGLLSPRLVRTLDGALWLRDARGAVWRAQTWIEGLSLMAADSPGRCREAGALLGRFHAALADLEHAYRSRRPGVHDTARHLSHLESAVRDGRGHRLFDQIEPVAHAVLAQARDLDMPAGLPGRHVHGDPKISNVLFDPDGRALCLVDLDTLARMPLPVELGDALRSWCSPQGEEVEAEIALDYFEAALAGYAASAAGQVGEAERQAVPAAVETIAVELASRFCADAIEERYFAFDPTRHASAAEHNLQRARAQLALARSIRARRAELERIAARSWAGGQRSPDKPQRGTTG
ncbi:MAG: aminoglycoside phosphotransferase family protein [Deltaproteobacteria bacterium]|nr:aminoglycoside phosphotransferase family protein [Deltaproteobacteria bacterium]